MVKTVFLILFFLVAAISPIQAKETVVSQVEWTLPGLYDESLFCQLTRGPQSLMQGELSCFQNPSKDGGFKKGKKIFSFRDDRSPISIAPALGPVSDALVTMWESAAYACYTVFGYNNGKARQLFSECSKGEMETIFDGNGGIVFIVSEYEPSKALPINSSLFWWNTGKTAKKKVSYQQRLIEAMKLGAEHNKEEAPGQTIPH